MSTPSRAHFDHRHRCGQGRRFARGHALVEALIAFAVLALGSLSVVRMQGTWSVDAAIAGERSQALRLGQREIESLRAFAPGAAAAGARSFDDITAATTAVDRTAEPPVQANFRIIRSVAQTLGDHAKTVSVVVAWVDRRGEPQQVDLRTVIARVDPSGSGALQVGPPSPTAHHAQGRAAAIPLTARNLGDGRSAIRLAGLSAALVLLDNRTGAIVARCDIDPARPVDDLTNAELEACIPVNAQLLSGIVRFAPAGWAPPQRADGLPLPMSIAITLRGGIYAVVPTCATEAVKAVSFVVDGKPTSRTVPIEALPASVGALRWDETGDRFVTYRCMVVPSADGRWSGRTTVTPAGWAVGLGAGMHRVCRYISDIDRSGAIDRNIEHPDAYLDVTGALVQQNFLVVPGGDECPDLPDAGDPRVATLTTAPHQP